MNTKITINMVRELASQINNKTNNTIGSIKISHDVCGIIINKIVNSSYGVDRLGYGLTKKEAYNLLQKLVN